MDIQKLVGLSVVGLSEKDIKTAEAARLVTSSDYEGVTDVSQVERLLKEGCPELDTRAVYRLAARLFRFFVTLRGQVPWQEADTAQLVRGCAAGLTEAAAEFDRKASCYNGALAAVADDRGRFDAAASSQAMIDVIELAEPLPGGLWHNRRLVRAVSLMPKAEEEVEYVYLNPIPAKPGQLLVNGLDTNECDWGDVPLVTRWFVAEAMKGGENLVTVLAGIAPDAEDPVAKFLRGAPGSLPSLLRRRYSRFIAEKGGIEEAARLAEQEMRRPKKTQRLAVPPPAARPVASTGEGYMVQGLQLKAGLCTANFDAADPDVCALLERLYQRYSSGPKRRELLLRAGMQVERIHDAGSGEQFWKSNLREFVLIYGSAKPLVEALLTDGYPGAHDADRLACLEPARGSWPQPSASKDKMLANRAGLRRLLCRAYTNQSLARMMVASSSQLIPLSNVVNWNQSAALVWADVLEAAERHGLLIALYEAVIADKGSAGYHQEIAELCT
jgi:hypothetical protein